MPDADFDFLAAGETLQLTYNVTVSNVAGSSSESVTITITGTDDQPVVTTPETVNSLLLSSPQTDGQNHIGRASAPMATSLSMKATRICPASAPMVVRFSITIVRLAKRHQLTRKILDYSSSPPHPGELFTGASISYAAVSSSFRATTRSRMSMAPTIGRKFMFTTETMAPQRYWPTRRRATPSPAAMRRSAPMANSSPWRAAATRFRLPIEMAPSSTRFPPPMASSTTRASAPTERPSYSSRPRRRSTALTPKTPTARSALRVRPPQRHIPIDRHA